MTQQLGERRAAHLLYLQAAERLVVDEVISQLPEAGPALIAFDEVDLAQQAAVVDVVDSVRAREPRVAVALATRVAWVRLLWDDAPLPVGV